MKTEDLKNQGLTEEQIKFVMAENGADIKKYKDMAENQKSQLDDFKQKMEEANKQIESFKEMDIESIKKNAEEYKKKYEESQKESEIKLKALQYDTALNEYVKKLNITDDVYLNDLTKQIKEKDLKFEDGTLLGGEDFVKSYKEKHPNAFKDSQKPTFSTGIDTTSANNNTKINELRKAMGLPEKKI